ncbi:MAG: thioredoxin-like domain-containing protein [Phycisphaerales bacterium]
MATTCKRWWAGLLLIMVAMPGVTAQAQVKVGDKPAIDWQSVDGQRITSEKLSGRIVILDFWATWCGPCMMEVPHMVELNKTYKDKGVRIIGISLDDNINRMKQVTQKKGMDWSQVCDGRGRESPYKPQWGVTGIPRVFIIGPEGQVLWSGHPAEMDQPLEKAMREHPPTYKERDRSKAKELLRQATANLNKGQWAGVAENLAALPPGPLDEAEFKGSIRTFMGSYDRIANSASSAAKELADAIAANADAASLLKALQERVPSTGHVANTSVGEATASTGSDAHNAKLAAIRLRNADQYREAGKDVEAYRLYKQIVEQYADTDAAAKAGPRVEAYEKDEAFMAKVALAAQEEEATRYLMMARSYFKTGRMEQAIAQCDQILQKFPHTDCAKEAAQIKRNAQQAQ